MRKLKKEKGKKKNENGRRKKEKEQYSDKTDSFLLDCPKYAKIKPKISPKRDL